MESLGTATGYPSAEFDEDSPASAGRKPAGVWIESWQGT